VRQQEQVLQQCDVLLDGHSLSVQREDEHEEGQVGGVMD